jgi:hypothetical protein
VINGYINDENLVERTETWLGENIMGDMHIVTTYSGWRDFGGFKAPTEIVQTRGGWPFFEVDVTSAEANPRNLAAIAPAPADGPGGPGGGPGGPLEVTTEELGPGLYRLTTGPGSYDSLLVEFSNYVMLLEAGQSQTRAQAYVDEVKRLVPDKPIRYVMNTHAHADHTGGLPVLVAEGATIVTHENNREFFERALNTPRTLLDDSLARNPRRARVEGVEDMRVYTTSRTTSTPATAASAMTCRRGSPPGSATGTRARCRRVFRPTTAATRPIAIRAARSGSGTSACTA